MAPALTEPLSPTNKLSTSATTGSPRPTSNNLLNTTNINNNNNNNTNSNTNITSDSTNQIINNNLSENKDSNNCINYNSSGSCVSAAAAAAATDLYNNIKKDISSCTNNNNNNNNTIINTNSNTGRGAFQLAFEEVVAKQTANAVARNKHLETNLLILKTTTPTIITTTITNGKKYSKFLFNKKPMGPMCDMNITSSIANTCINDSTITTTVTNSNTNCINKQIINSIEIDGFIKNQNDEEFLSDNNKHHMENYTNRDNIVDDNSRQHQQHQHIEDNQQQQQQQQVKEELEEEEIHNVIESQQHCIDDNNQDNDENVEHVKKEILNQSAEQTNVDEDKIFETNQESSNIPVQDDSQESQQLELINEEVQQSHQEIEEISLLKTSTTTPTRSITNTSTIYTEIIRKEQLTPSNIIQISSILTPQSTTSVGSSCGTNTSNTGMGLQKDFIKDSSDMEQVLGEFTTNDMDLLQVLKGFDSTPGGEAALCDLAGSLGLFNDVDVMNYEEIGTPSTATKDVETNQIRNEIEKRQQEMQRRCDFLLRRLRKIQARYMGKHVSEEISGLFEWTNRIVRRKDHNNHSGSVRNDIDYRHITYDDDKHRPVSTSSMRSLLRRIDSVAIAQHSNVNKRNNIKIGGRLTHLVHNQNIGGGGGITSNEQNSQKQITSVVPSYDEKTTIEIERVSGMLQTELKEVQVALDSDVTESSSGGESADETVSYNNQVQQSLSVAKRAAWRWARDRSAIASRWTWLLAQISDLEYRIRQHNELHHQIKKNKGAVSFEKTVISSTSLPSVSAATASSSSTTATSSSSSQPIISTNSPTTSVGSIPSSVNGYRGLLPGNSKSLDTDSGVITSPPPPNGAYDQQNTLTSAADCNNNATMGSCRTRPFQRVGFRKRKLLQTANVHTVSKKAARPSTVKCGCQSPLHPCALCTGRSDPTAPRDLPDTMTPSERVALLDPGFHPVLSFPEDVSTSILFEATLRLPEWQNRVIRCSSKSALKGAVAAQKAAEREERSKKYLDNNNSRRKYSRKYPQDLMAANKMKQNAKNRRALHGVGNNNKNQFNHLIKSKHHRKMLTGSSSLNAGGSRNGINSNNGGSGMISSLCGGGFDSATGSFITNDNYDNSNASGTNGHHFMPRSKNSSPTPGSYSNYKNERLDRRNRNSYDIDNIVIPYSVAAATRVEILPYKEIPTPKWRVLDDEEEEKKTDLSNKENEINEIISNINENSKNLDNENSLPAPAAAVVTPSSIPEKSEEFNEKSSSSTSVIIKAEQNEIDGDDDDDDDDENEIEDISYEAIQIRHERALIEERRKFQTYLKFPWSTRSRANRRIDSRAESSGANTPDPTSPAPNTPSVPGDQESIPSPAAPSTPLTPLDAPETVDGTTVSSTINNQGSIIVPSNPPLLNNNLAAARRYERKRTVSIKKERDSNRDELRRSNTPDLREIVPPFEPLQFPLSDDIYETMLQLMPNDHHLLEECLKSDASDGGSGNPGDKDFKNGINGGKNSNTILTGGLNTFNNAININERHRNNSNISNDILMASDLAEFGNSDSLMMGGDSDTDSAESGLADEDPNDPEWREPT